MANTTARADVPTTATHSSASVGKGLLLVAVTVGPFAAMTLLAVWLHSTWMSDIAVAILVEAALLLGLLVVVAWPCWFGPWRAAGRERTLRAGAASSRRQLRASRVMAFAPFIVMTLALLTMMVAAVVASAGRGVSDGFHLLPWLVFVNAPLLGAALPAGMIALWLLPKLERRLRETARRCELCFGCGYSFHGLESDRCPECGTPTETGEVDTDEH